MSVRTITVDIVSPVCAYVSGYGSREMLCELRGRPPIWAGNRRAWVTQEHTARDLVAIAESRGYLVLLGAREGAC